MQMSILTTTLTLPRADGTRVRYEMAGPSTFPRSAQPPRTRVAFAAVHVVCDPLADINPTLDTALDWDATLAYRRHLWSLGLAVAEAMDTAQRGMGLDWITTKELIRRSLDEARAVGGRIACGAGTDHFAPPYTGLMREEIAAAYEEQIGYVEAHGTGTPLGDPIEMRALTAALATRADRPRWYVGSVKTNLGHLEAAAGMAGLLKAVLAVGRGQIPAHLHLDKLNPNIDLSDTGAAIPAMTTAWPDGYDARVAGVSSFGFTGSNAHVIVEEEAGAPASAAPAGRPQRTVCSLPIRPLRTSSQARRKFARYWLLVRPFSGLTRILLLRAVKRRAEA